MPKKALFFRKKVDKHCKMSYIINISKDAYKQNNTYYLRKGNTMKKSFVFAAVAATIAASSSMAAVVNGGTATVIGTPATIEWTGDVSGLLDVCNFVDQANGSMEYTSGTGWQSDAVAFVEIKQRGSNKIIIEPDHYVRETVSLGGATLSEGVAHAVNVDYSAGSLAGKGISGETYVQHATQSGQQGNTQVLDLATATGVKVTNTVGSNVPGNGVEMNDNGQLDNDLKGSYVLEGQVSDGNGGFNTGVISYNHLKLTIEGSATLVNGADEALIKNNSTYALTHTVSCLQ